MLASYWIPAEANNPGMYHFICAQNILPGADPTSRASALFSEKVLAVSGNVLRNLNSSLEQTSFFSAVKGGFFGGVEVELPPLLGRLATRTGSGHSLGAE